MVVLAGSSPWFGCTAPVVAAAGNTENDPAVAGVEKERLEGHWEKGNWSIHCWSYPKTEVGSYEACCHSRSVVVAVVVVEAAAE